MSVVRLLVVIPDDRPEDGAYLRAIREVIKQVTRNATVTQLEDK